MATFEGEQRTLIHSAQIVVQSLTTTGYGQDAPWGSPYMGVLMMTIQATGIAYLFLALPALAGPWIENAIQPDAPETTDAVEGHIVITGYSPLAATLVEELESRGIEYVIVEPDEDRARDLDNEDRPVVAGDPGSVETLDNAYLETASAMIVDATEELNIDAVLSATELTDDCNIISIVEAPTLASYLRHAGADRVLTPRHRLGKSLADKALNTITTDLDDAVTVGEDIETVELPVQRGSDLHGQRLGTSRITDRPGVHLLGAWVRGDFVTPVAPDTYIDESTVLLLAGDPAELREIEGMTRSGTHSPTHGTTIVAGLDIAGSTAKGILERAGLTTVGIDTEDGEEVDIVGSATDDRTLYRANIEAANTLIVTSDDDRESMLATLVAKDLNPDIEVIVGANETETTGNIYRAGADYVLSFSKVAGRMLALDLFDDQAMALDEEVTLTGTTAPELVGQSPDDTDIRERTGTMLVGIERDEDVITELNEGVTIAEDDTLIVAGTTESIDAFEAEYGE